MYSQHMTQSIYYNVWSDSTLLLYICTQDIHTLIDLKTKSEWPRFSSFFFEISFKNSFSLSVNYCVCRI